MNKIARLSTSYARQPVLQALLSLAPGGGAADALLKKRAEEIRDERTKIFFDELSTGKTQLTSDLIESDEFLHCYFSTLKAARNTLRREKIQMLAHLLKNSFAGKNLVGADEYEEALAAFDELSSKEFLVLSELHSIETKNPPDTSKNEVQNKSAYWAAFKSAAIEKHGVPENEFLSFMHRLQRTGFYLELLEPTWDYKRDMGKTTPRFEKLLRILNEAPE